MRRLEAFCDALAAYHHYYDPESESYDLRNPGMLLGPDGKRKFSCHRAGYASLLDRVQKQCVANPEMTVESLFDHFGIKMRLQKEQALDFMARCSNSTLKLNTTLVWFIEK